MFLKEVCYQYDCVGDLVKLTYPDDTEVNYTYDANHNLVSVVDWANRTTTYTYDENNKLIGVVKPDGSVTTTAYDSKQRITSTVERTPQEVVITGFEYTYDDLDRLIEEKHLDNNTKMCYTYDSLSRVTKKTLLSEEDVVISEENFTYDAAGNITSDSSNATYSYGPNNKLASYAGQNVEYDLDGNMLSVQIDGTMLNLQYDSSNKLVLAGGCTYTYNAENTRIRNLCEEEDTTYTYNTNCRLSQLLQKTTNGVTTKYVYGRGLIGEETNSVFKTYHFDFRGSTIAITDITGAITDTFKYDTYGKLIERTGTSAVIFAYNGRDGVVTDSNGLVYMRARYYAPNLKRFVNADIIAGEISNAITLNRYAYANANPVSFIDSLGLSAERGSLDSNKVYEQVQNDNKNKTEASKYDKVFDDTLEQIFLLESQFVVSGSVTIPVPPNATLTYSTSTQFGDGNHEISIDVSDQLSILESLTFDTGNNGSIKVDSEGNVTVEAQYTYENTTVTTSFSGIPGVKYTISYGITTTDEYNNSLTTNLEYKYTTNSSSNNTDEQEKTGEEFDWGTALAVGYAVVATVVAVVAIAETVATYGAGIWNDFAAVANAVSSWINVFSKVPA